MSNKQKLKSAGLAIFYKNKLLLCHQRGRKPNEGYGIPKGLIDEGETILQAAIRETKEEVGIIVPEELVDISNVFTCEVNTHKYNKIVYCYKVMINDLSDINLTDEIISPSNLQLEEVDDARFMNKKEALEKITKSQKKLHKKLTI